MTTGVTANKKADPLAGARTPSARSRSELYRQEQRDFQDQETAILGSNRVAGLPTSMIVLTIPVASSVVTLMRPGVEKRSTASTHDCFRQCCTSRAVAAALAAPTR